jgi:hypothetical protein
MLCRSEYYFDHSLGYFPSVYQQQHSFCTLVRRTICGARSQPDCTGQQATIVGCKSLGREIWIIDLDCTWYVAKV